MIRIGYHVQTALAMNGATIEDFTTNKICINRNYNEDVLSKVQLNVIISDEHLANYYCKTP